MGSFNLDIVTPIRELKVGIVSYARCPGIDGQFGIMNNHREGIFALSVGELKITQNGKDEYFATGGGFAEIIDNSVKLLVESIESSIEINMDRAQESFERAKKRKIKDDPEINLARAEASLMRALNRLRVSKR
ncbi:MAG: ATP synthase F1 subunit epsilon [Candidatus Marinimicrobia bacterium]|nr:ATP synthase F1 subunit epsilon [Candidatus Neomarinimicrobiota bacterium]|tara:strand:+ start:1581 stop:1979 length:399 start_codon:yes stop_codon:yes gene_type:complete